MGGTAGLREHAAHVRFAWIAGALAACALAGWILGLPRLATFVAQRPSLSPMTALMLLLGSAALAALPQRRSMAKRLAALECACGVAIVAAHLLDWPQRMPLPPAWWSSRLTGVAFAASGTATVLLAAGRSAGGQLLAFCVLLFAGLLALGHVFPDADLYTYVPGTGVAIPTVMAFAALSIGQLVCFGAAGVSGALTSRNTAGKASRQLLFAGAAVATLLTLLDLFALRQGLFDAETAVLLVAWAAMALLGITLWGLAVAVDRAELARAAAERDRNEVRQMVAAALTHDLRSPLQAATLSGLVLEKLAQDVATTTAVARLQRSHRRLDRLLRSLLDSLALGGGESLKLRASSFDLQDLLQEVLSENEAVLADRVAWEGAAHGWWDREALFRVVENLLLNAVKYGDRSTPIWCRIHGGDGFAKVCVENAGSTIPEAEWEAIFEPFSRGEGTRGAEHVGWGVGLAYARSVAVSHGGTVRVAASHANKTIFELRLPLDARPALAQARTASPAAA